jgi:hypothetical protein
MATKKAILTLYYRTSAAYPFRRYASLFIMAVINIDRRHRPHLHLHLPVPPDRRRVLHGQRDVHRYRRALPLVHANQRPYRPRHPAPPAAHPHLAPYGVPGKCYPRGHVHVAGFVNIVHVVRVVFLQEALKDELLLNPSASITATTAPPNFTYHASFSLMWSAVEVSVGIMCCCVLVLKPLVMCVMPKLLHAPHIRHHRPSGTPESLLRSSTSEDARTSDSIHLGDVPSRALVTQLDKISLSPRAAELSWIESPVSPLSPKRLSLSVIPERSTNDDDGESLEFFEMMRVSHRPRLLAPGRRSRAPSTRRTSAPRRSTVLSESLATVQANASQEPTQNFFDFVQVKGKVP